MNPQPTLLLSRSDVRALLSMAAAIAAVEAAFAAHGEGRTQMPPKVYLDLEDFGGDLRAMPAYVDGAAGVKWVNSHPMNPARFDLPSVMGLYILTDPATALPLSVMDATLLTAVRTGAAAAIASKHLGPKDPRTIGFVGSGVQARFLLDAHRAIFGDTLEVLAADVSEPAAAAFAKESGGRVVSVREASGADIVCTSTPARRPVVERAWVKDGAHINAMGADAQGKQELDPEILLAARVVIDDWDQATHSGEVNVPLHDGFMSREHIHGTLGEVIAGKRPGREGARITVFDSTGLAVQDVALARVIHAAAREKGAGTPFDFNA
ncbi:ornithine cyclodeaminase family protein [Polyangium aurulentum]|uniref:ornithine cyclodeaminase family protein n=1 Tax=Polyangium aurulentum TaxID=2567896 RepID=UPI0010AE5917|nr:ornithine cyclodeaminase family protein [Polyangium aurulentum]UQA57599.1 ornithine cyclodeaminase family protein [Polyangium aurulentum]